MVSYAHSGRLIPGRGALLSAAEECELAVRARAGDEGAASRLAHSQLGFVVRIARRYRTFGVPMADLIQEGMIGVLQAIRRFDPARNIRLCTYAAWWIRAHMQAYVVRSWSLVRFGTSTNHRALFFRLRRMVGELKDGAGQISDEVQKLLAQKFRVPLNDVAALARRITGSDQSLDQPAGDRARGPPLEHLADPAPSPEDHAVAGSESRYRRGLLARAMQALTQRERAVIHGRYMAELIKTRDALGRELGISAERVRQLEQVALAKLRRLLAPLRAAV